MGEINLFVSTSYVKTVSFSHFKLIQVVLYLQCRMKLMDPTMNQSVLDGETGTDAAKILGRLSTWNILIQQDDGSPA